MSDRAAAAERLAVEVILWEQSRRRVRDLKDERMKFFCIRAERVTRAYFEEAAAEQKQDPLATFEFPQPSQEDPCWKNWQYGAEDRTLPPQSEWCESCRQRQAVHDRLIEATREHATRLRALQILARNRASLFVPFVEAR